ncbi:hypothetical protein QYF36_009449 [Acer negundo]|nr:hypothetical protein QYF36_009449 [Acer negundo]
MQTERILQKENGTFVWPWSLELDLRLLSVELGSLANCHPYPSSTLNSLKSNSKLHGHTKSYGVPCGWHHAGGIYSGSDRIIWDWSQGGDFYVKSEYEGLSDAECYSSWPWKFIWNIKLPPRVQHFLWVFMLGVKSIIYRSAKEWLDANVNRSRKDTAFIPVKWLPPGEDTSGLGCSRHCSVLSSV